MMQAVIVSGPPGSGKSTQAKRLAEKHSLTHFDTGSFLHEIPEFEKTIAEGDIIDSRKILPLVREKIFEISKDNGIVLSGSPRTTLEAMGDSETEGIMKILEGIYGKENIHVFKIEIPEEVSIERNSKRTDHRADDKLDVIVHRLKEYREDTMPMYEKIEESGYNLYKIDGTPSREEVFDQIEAQLNE
ncbi:MAG: hypothetical protein COT88_01400 [Candidatus Colwellbacteria bacterium CG10_big_fil_rev_8_21_14_0_10_41_28]|uniref:Adenylate kinase n=1 Tax=Candidatus Colwellbacteria bacterium CG10_big_fil_rev_8_21_14_0_10_41_28 TaxID=1974539 RepID=A0A2H0VHA8_9BACT|nr:MAG: hypothetical protein COT88_01400 [Candidatus Colwellbacteria bacterium CG10_big_fil_rev_8_21_14_0_10_41_28]